MRVSHPVLVAPVSGYHDNNPAWAVCLRYNPKNEYGAYAGIHTTVFFFRQSEMFWRMLTDLDVYGISEIVRNGIAQEVNRWLDAGYDLQGVVQDAVPRWIQAMFIWGYCKDAVWTPWPDIKQTD